MKRMKKLVGVLLALVMILGMTTTAFAVDITVEKNDAVSTDSQYSAYMLLGAEVLTDGSGKYNFTVNEKYEAILKEVTGKTDHTDIIEYIEGLNAAGIRDFADAVYTKIKANTSITADKVSNQGVISGAVQGYYLIAETTLSSTADTYSLVMLDTAGKENITIDTKEDEPAVTKQVEELNDSLEAKEYEEWGNHADYDVNDVIRYRIKGTVSGEYANYENYYYAFTDEMQESLTFNKDSIHIYVGGSVDETTNAYIPGVEVTSQFLITKEDNSFVAETNLKELDAANDNVTIDASTEIYITYTATLNSAALHGKPGNINTVYLEYENNPYLVREGDGDPTTPDRPGDPDDPTDPDNPGKTPEVQNIVFTFKASVNKVDDNNKALEGAGFTLYKWDADAVGDDKWAAVGNEVTGVTTFEFRGLDVGKYKLVETTVPNGYNKAADIEFNVKATYATDELTGLAVVDKDGAAITDFTIITNDESELGEDLGTFVTTVVNKPGVTLPSTGGMGTTIFYVLGAILVIGSAVILITRKRMSAK